MFNASLKRLLLVSLCIFWPDMTKQQISTSMHLTAEFLFVFFLLGVLALVSL